MTYECWKKKKAKQVLAIPFVKRSNGMAGCVMLPAGGGGVSEQSQQLVQCTCVPTAARP